jgi:HK97 family phage major capsid protein
MDNEVKKAVDALNRTWENDLKPKIAQLEAEQKSSGESHTETKQAVDHVQDRMDALEVQLQNASFAPRHTEGEPSQEVKDMIEYVRTTKVTNESSKLYAASSAGDGPKYDGLGQKVLAIRDETLGGVLAPADFIAEVVTGIIQFSPMRDIVTVRPTSRTSIQFPKRTGNFAAAWTAETSTRTETTGRTYGLEEIPTHELYARVLISNWDLEDPVVDLQSIIAEDMAVQFAVSEGAAFVNGNGIGKPAGLLASTDVQANAIGQGASSFTNADGLIKLAFSVKEQYWPNARFVLNRFSLRDIRLLKDTAGNYLWQPAADGVHGISTGLPATLYGYPYTIAVDYPTAASNAYTVSFGDHKRAYWIADRIEIQMLRDPFTQASAGAVVLHARKRVGGQVVLPEAVNVLQMA